MDSIFQYEVLIRKILAAFWYNRSNSEVKELCEELKNRFAKRNCKHTTDGDDLYSTFIMIFGDYGTSPRSGWLEKISPEFMINEINDFENEYLRMKITYKDGPFTLTDDNHYFVLMADHKYNDESDLVEYSGMHHATRDSARMELAYAQGDDWGDNIKSIEVKEVHRW